MTESSFDDPILLLHSSCRGDYEAVSFSGSEFTTSGNTTDDLSEPGLLKQTIFCDLLLLPEHPSPSSSQHDNDYLHIAQNPLHPCGVSNVLALENLSEHWITGPVLLSLSSCIILFGNGDDDDKLTTPIPLPLDPIPSTFVLDFHGNQDIADSDNEHDDKGEKEQPDSMITSVNMVSEIFVEFDVSEALRQAQELLLRSQENSTRINEVKDKEEWASADESKNHPDDFQRQKGRFDTRDVLHLQDDGKEAKVEDDFHPRLEDIAHGLNLGASFASKDFNEQKVLLEHLKVQLEQETRTMDTVLSICGFVCIFSMVILLWTIYQYYRTIFKSDQFSQEIRESIKTTNDILHIAVNELNQYENYKRERPHSDPPKLNNLNALGQETYADENEETKNLFPTTLSDISADIDHQKISSKSPEKRERGYKNMDKQTENLFPTTLSGITIDVDHQNISSKSPEKYGRELKSNLVLSRQDYATRRTTYDPDVIISLVDQGKERIEDKESASPITPPRDNNVADTRRQYISSTGTIADERKVEGKTLENTTEGVTAASIFLEQNSSPFQVNDVHTSPHQQAKKKLSFLGCQPSPHKKAHLKKFDYPPSKLAKEENNGGIPCQKKNEALESPCSRLSEDWSDREMAVPSQRTMSPAPLSPCSQLAKEWNEGKTLRRSNLKKRRQYLKPILQLNAETNTACDDDEGGKSLFASTILPQVPKTSKLHCRYYQQQAETCTILDPPKLRSIVRKNNSEDVTIIKSMVAEQVVEDENEDADRKVIEGMKTPPWDSITQKAPRLCYTPASEDNSFIDDYW